MRVVPLSPWSWGSAQRRPSGVGTADLLRMAALLIAPANRPVAALAGGSAGLAQLLELMSAAILNTSSAHASARLMGRVFRRLLVPGATRLLVAREGLGPDLVRPLQQAVTRSGEIRYGRRLIGVERSGQRATILRFGDGDVELEAGDRVVLALPPAALPALLPDLPAPSRFAPIVNLHVPHESGGPVRFVGITGGLAQWMLVRPGMLSVTISAAGEVAGLASADLAARVWPEIAAAATCAGIAVAGASAKWVMVVKERTATPLQDCAYLNGSRPARLPLANLALAGDWTTNLPATIEAAVVAAHEAVRRIGPAPDERRSVRTAEREFAA
jgi:hydroxysqualene dehydroxylase